MTRFDAQGRVDTTLMSNLRIMRRTLINQISKRCDKSKETITSVVHSLLSRSIFIKYLEERKDSNGETVFPQGFYSDFLESAKQYYPVQEYTETVREQCAVELKKLAQLQKMWALRKPILDAHILSLQGKVQVLEQEIDEIVIETIIHQT